MMPPRRSARPSRARSRRSRLRWWPAVLALVLASAGTPALVVGPGPTVSAQGMPEAPVAPGASEASDPSDPSGANDETRANDASGTPSETPDPTPATTPEQSDAQPADRDAAVEATPTEPPPMELALVSDELIAQRGGEGAWRLALPAQAGSVVLGEPRDGLLPVGHGAYLLGVDLETGVVATRDAMPGPVVGLTRDERGVVVVELDHGPSGITTRTVMDGERDAPARFGTEAAAFGALARAAAAAADPASRAEQDPTDPWLAIEAFRAAADDEARSTWLDRVEGAATGLPFFETLPLAGELASAGAWERADALFEAGLADLAARGYDPRLATDPDLRSAYGFPEDRLRRALADDDLGTALRLAPYAWRLAAEEAPASVAVLHELADALRTAPADAVDAALTDGAGPREAAGVWRERARALDRAGLDTWVDGLALRLGALGWWGVAGLLVAFVLTWLVLWAKVSRAQALARRQLKERDQAPPSVTRLWVPRHASTTEKLALIALLVVTGLQAALAGWHDEVREPDPALRSGTLASVEAIAAVDALPATPRGAWLRGLSWAQRGDLDAARSAWRDAGALAPALTNRAVAQGNDEGLLEAALRADPREPVARFRSGRADDPSPFHATTVPDAALWAVPSPLDLRLATAGDWRAALATALTAPWTALGQARPETVSPWLAWPLAIAYGLLALALAAFLVVPRPRVSRDAPRTFAYHLGALAVPGSGHADELWGLLLLIPWALIGSDALLAAATGTGPLGLSPTTHAWLLAGLWAINTVGFAVELASYRHRMRLLRERKPELARSYGLPPAPRPEA